MPPKQKPGRSKQTYRTPVVFLNAVKRLLAIDAFAIDLAATPENAVAARYYTQAQNSLVQSWNVGGVAFCNPPFSHLEPWVKKAWAESQIGARIALLVPAGVGSNWFRDYVHNKARVLLLNGRIVFVGETAGYPKDLALLLYGFPEHRPGYSMWTWALPKRRKKAA